MHIISRKRLLEACALHPDLYGPLDAWYRLAKRASWASLEDVRNTLPQADAVGPFTVFNMKGNRFRLIAEINYRSGRIFIRHVLTHPEYDREGWKR